MSETRVAGHEIDAAVIARMVGLRRDLHRWPELSGNEYKSRARIADELNEIGLTDVRQIAGTGLAVDVVGDPAGPCVVVRADMDALPIAEQSGLPFSSDVPGVMHACGHDAHSAMGFGAASLAAASLAAAGPDALPGTLRFVFQPAEEAEPLGGRRVVSEGHLDDVAAAVALHVDPNLETGAVGLRSGPSMASSDEFTITVQGQGGHAGWPHEAVDAIAAAAAIVGELQKVVSRRVDPRAPVALHIGRIEGGSASNVVAESVTMAGTIRALSTDARDTVRRLLGEVSDSTARACGARATVELVVGEPVLDNDPAVIAAFAAAARPGTVHRLAHATMNSEDFAFYTERVPAAMAWIGVGGEGHAPLHHPRFTLDEAVLPIGATLLFAAACALLADPPGKVKR